MSYPKFLSTSTLTIFTILVNQPFVQVTALKQFIRKLLMISLFLLTKATSVLALLDFSSAINTIDQPILVLSLHADFGFTDTVLQWFPPYLTDRTHYAPLSNHCSAFAPVHTGVPHGSVLVPMLFIMYIKTLSAIIDSHSIIHHSFADDLQLQMSAPLMDYLSYFTLRSHVLVMSMLWQLQTCLNLNLKQKSRLSPVMEISISITNLLQPLLEMLKFPSNSLWRIWILH